MDIKDKNKLVTETVAKTVPKRKLPSFFRLEDGSEWLSSRYGVDHMNALSNGQCDAYASESVGFANGYGGIKKGERPIDAKRGLVDSTIGSQWHPIRPGDVAIFDMNNDIGHVAVIAAVRKGKNGRPEYVLSEANFNNDGKVNHGRTVPYDDPGIIGYAPGIRMIAPPGQVYMIPD